MASQPTDTGVPVYDDGAAQRLGFAPPEACRPGIEANLALLDQHASLLFDYLRDARPGG